MSNVILCGVAAPAHAFGGWRVGAFGAGREFGGVLRVVLAVGDAAYAVPKPWLPAIQAKRTIKLALIALSGLMLAIHY
jgi:hypothetical protein